MSVSAIVAQPQVVPAASPQESDFLPHDRVIAHSGDTFEGMAGTILSVHALASRHPFAFVSLDDPRYHDDQLWFPLADLVGSAERKARTVIR